MPYRAPDQRAVTPQGEGRFPGFDVLEEVRRWDDVTAGIVLARLAPTTDLSFFTLTETGTVTALTDQLLHQFEEPRVPVVAMIDARLAADETDGWHYDDMPIDPDAWRQSLAALDEDAQRLADRRFADLERAQQAAIVQRIQDLGSSGEKWHGWPAKQIWSLWTRYACAAFYAHPWAWNEIGYPGPAYPRGYKNIGVDAREGFEVEDHGDTDPVSHGDRVEQAREDHARRIGPRLGDPS